MSEPLDIRLDASTLRRLERAWRKAPELVVDEMATAVWEASLLVEREVRERTSIGVGGGGGLAGSIAAREPEVLGEEVIGTVGTSLRYAIPVELGRRPGQRQPPLAPLADWAVAKLGVSRDQAMGVAFAIARKIARRGTEGAHMFRDGAKAAQGEVERIFVAGAERVVARLAQVRA